MGKLKSEFHEVIAGEYGAVEDLENTYHTAYEAYFALHERLPVYRTPKQQRTLDEAYEALASAKWKMDQAAGWAEIQRYHR